MRNPFVFPDMVRDPEAFFGRKKILRDLYGKLNKLEKCSVVGPRRIGKSSLLYHMTLPSMYSLYLDKPETYVFAFIDLQVVAPLGVDDFLRGTVKALCQASLGRLSFPPEEYGNEREFLGFLEKARAEKLKLVLCCDEIESLNPRKGFKCDDAFFTFLRGVLSNYDLAMVTSSQTPLSELCYTGDLPTSPFWNIFVKFPLGLMTEEEMLSLIKEPFIRSGINLTDDEIIFISDLAGPHPFFLQMACHYLFEARVTQESPDLSDVGEQFFRNAVDHYDHAWRKLSDKQKEGLKSFIRDGTLPEKTILNKLEDNAIVTDQRKISSGWKRFIEQQDGNVDVFISYSHKDEEFRDKLEKHLNILKRQSVISTWHDRKITAGTEWKGEIDKHLDTAQIILLLISADFLASDYCEIEMKRAMERHEAGEVRVIPIILRPVDWENALIGKLEALPKDAKAVSLWKNRDEAFTDIAGGIRAAVKEVRAG